MGGKEGGFLPAARWLGKVARKGARESLTGAATDIRREEGGSMCI
jgi:hypothetical protein